MMGYRFSGAAMANPLYYVVIHKPVPTTDKTLPVFVGPFGWSSDARAWAGVACGTRWGKILGVVTEREAKRRGMRYEKRNVIRPVPARLLDIRIAFLAESYRREMIG